MMNKAAGKMGIGTDKVDLYAPKFTFYPGVVQFRPVNTTLAYMTECYRRGAVIHHYRRMVAAVAHLAALDSLSSRIFWTHVASYATASGSLAGLESLYLTAMQDLWLMQDEKLYRAGIRLWDKLGPEKPGADGSAKTCFLIYDRESSLLSMVPVSSIDRLWRDLSQKGFRADGGPAAAIRAGGYGADKADEARMSYGKCLGTFTSVGSIIGGFGGLLAHSAEIEQILGDLAAEDDADALAELESVWENIGPILNDVGKGAAMGSLAGLTLGGLVCSDDIPSQGPSSCGEIAPPLVDAPDDPTEEDPPPEGSDPSEWASFPTYCGGYPAPDDNSPGGPNSMNPLGQPLSFPNPEGGGEGGPKGVPAGTATFLCRAMPRLGSADARAGFLINSSTMGENGKVTPLRKIILTGATLFL